MNSIYTCAIRKASEIRLQLGIDLFQPLNIYDACSNLGIDVQFVDINMEGLYINNLGTPKILLSSLRPFPRRVFTCGHELGHHLFNHGLKVDVISDDREDSLFKSQDEKLVDAFAAALLMPIGGIQSEFAKKKLNFDLAKPVDFYTTSSLFGVGYKTLVTHCKINKLINDSKSIELLKATPAKIFKEQFGNVEDKAYFKIIDGNSKAMPIDLEVSNYLVLPSDFIVEDKFLLKKNETKLGSLYIVNKPGISSVHSCEKGTSYFIRIQPQNYVGFAEYRHLQN